MECLKLLTVVTAHVALLPPRCPSLARKRGAAVRSLLHSHIAIPTVEHALGVAWGPHTVHRPGILYAGQLALLVPHARVADWVVAPLQPGGSIIMLPPLTPHREREWCIAVLALQLHTKTLKTLPLTKRS